MYDDYMTQEMEGCWDPENCPHCNPEVAKQQSLQEQIDSALKSKLATIQHKFNHLITTRDDFTISAVHFIRDLKKSGILSAKTGTSEYWIHHDGSNIVQEVKTPDPYDDDRYTNNLNGRDIFQLYYPEYQYYNYNTMDEQDVWIRLDTTTTGTSFHISEKEIDRVRASMPLQFGKHSWAAICK